MQGTQVQSLVWEDPTCHRATKPVQHTYRRLCAPEPTHTREASASRKPHLGPTEQPPLTTAREKPVRSNWDSVQPKMHTYINHFLKSRLLKCCQQGLKLQAQGLCDYSKSSTNLQVVNFQRCEQAQSHTLVHVSELHCHGCASFTSGHAFVYFTVQ